MTLLTDFFLALQVDEHRQLVLEDAARAANCFFRVDGAIGLDVEHQLVEVGALFNARGIDSVRHATHGAERCIELQAADRTRGFLERSALQSRTIAATLLDLQRHGQAASLGQVGNDQIRIHDFDVVIGLDVACRDRARALLDQAQLGAVARVHANGHGLEVQQDVNDILLHTLDAGVLMEHAFDLDFRDGRAGHRRQQHATQGIAQRVSETRARRARSRRAPGAAQPGAPSQHGASGIHLLRIASNLHHHFEYSSTTRFSLMSGSTSSRFGAALNTPRISFSLTSSHSGKPTCAATVSACWTRSCLRDFSRI